ncbi:MAG TPA: polyphosphate polymerase domain-containing protein [Draconibacterium sp.]|nr:polyphosphate polymerase domain-containing protein [Draconibacterium sp.]
MKDINDIVSNFSAVSLDEINEVKLMSRIDRKYWFHFSKLAPLLENALDDYDILEINGQRVMDYQTTYFDTPDSSMYIKHHNQKLNRVKIRQRNYVSTNNSFLEVKFKTNKKRTVKTRIATNFGPSGFIQTELEFIDKKTPFKGEELQPSLNNKFKRITLIHKQKLDRCTIDINPEFWDENGKSKIENLVIFEVKRGKSLKLSPIVTILRNLKIRQKGLSKYCTGRAILDHKLKQNAFKRRLNFITKKINQN